MSSTIQMRELTLAVREVVLSQRKPMTVSQIQRAVQHSSLVAVRAAVFRLVDLGQVVYQGQRFRPEK